MVSSRWQKQNIQFRNVGGVTTFVSTLLVVLIFNSLGQAALGALVSTLVFLVGFTVTFTLMNRNPNLMVRVLKIDYEEIERDFRILFKDNDIRFHRRVEDDAYRYDLPRQNLTMTIKPHVWHNWNFSRKGNPQPATLVTIYELNEKNRMFAEQLADLIDEMAAQLPNNWNKA